MTTWTEEFKHPIDYLLLESGDMVLEEDNASYLVLDQTGSATSLWTLQNKS